MKRKDSVSSAIDELARSTPVIRSADVVVCGAGPAGVAAALSAARSGAKTLLIESQGCLGGVWTSGLLTWIIDYENKEGIMSEILTELEAIGGRTIQPNGNGTPAYGVEEMKVVLERLCMQAGIDIRLHTRVVGGFFEGGGKRLSHVLLESPSGREAVAGKIFIDCTGNGDLAARAGCGFDVGHPESGLTQPMSLMALVGGLNAQEVKPFFWTPGEVFGPPKDRLLEAFRLAGVRPSYTRPTLFQLPGGLFTFMVNHQYEGLGIDADSLSRHTVEARAEVFQLARALRASGGPWRNLVLVATAAHIGVREGRRIHGRYQLTTDDLVEGARFHDAVCRVTFCVDVHSLSKQGGGGYGDTGIKVKPYDIPLRALVARDVDGLLLAGRCISGDFFAHASYRVTGNAVAMGEGAGKEAARCVKENRLPLESTSDRS